MSIQRRISKKKNRAMIGQELDVLVEGPSEDSELVMMGRHAGQAPEIDGCVYLSGGSALPSAIVTLDVSLACSGVPRDIAYTTPSNHSCRGASAPHEASRSK